MSLGTLIIIIGILIYVIIRRNSAIYINKSTGGRHNKELFSGYRNRQFYRNDKLYTGRLSISNAKRIFGDSRIRHVLTKFNNKSAAKSIFFKNGLLADGVVNNVMSKGGEALSGYRQESLAMFNKGGLANAGKYLNGKLLTGYDTNTSSPITANGISRTLDARYMMGCGGGRVYSRGKPWTGLYNGLYLVNGYRFSGYFNDCKIKYYDGLPICDTNTVDIMRWPVVQKYLFGLKNVAMYGIFNEETHLLLIHCALFAKQKHRIINNKAINKRNLPKFADIIFKNAISTKAQYISGQSYYTGRGYDAAYALTAGYATETIGVTRLPEHPHSAAELYMRIWLNSYHLDIIACIDFYGQHKIARLVGMNWIIDDRYYTNMRADCISYSKAKYVNGVLNGSKVWFKHIRYRYWYWGRTIMPNTTALVETYKVYACISNNILYYHHNNRWVSFGINNIKVVSICMCDTQYALYALKEDRRTIIKVTRGSVHESVPNIPEGQINHISSIYTPFNECTLHIDITITLPHSRIGTTSRQQRKLMYIRDNRWFNAFPSDYALDSRIISSICGWPH
jgi:hypothetical protein